MYKKLPKLLKYIVESQSTADLNFDHRSKHETSILNNICEVLIEGEWLDKPTDKYFSEPSKKYEQLQRLKQDEKPDEYFMAKSLIAHRDAFFFSKYADTYPFVIMNLLKTIEDTTPMINFENEAWVFMGSHFKKLSQGLLNSFLREVAKKQGLTVTQSHVNPYQDNLLKNFNKQAYKEFDQTGGINLSNGVVLISKKGEVILKPHAPKRYYTYCLDYEYNPDLSADRFQAFLNEVVPDKNLQDILQEFAGWPLLGNMLKLEKILILLGSGQNGKSVFLEILEHLFGGNNCSFLSLEEITDPNNRFARIGLNRKMLNICTDISNKVNADNLKKIASGEPIDVEDKGKSAITMTNYAKLASATNVDIDFEATRGFERRLLIVPFNVYIEDDKVDLELAKKITQNEMPGVLNWAIEGAQRLIENKRFTGASEARNAIMKMKANKNNVAAFVYEFNLIPSKENPASKYATNDVYPDYQLWCIEGGYKSFNKGEFAKQLDNAGIKTTTRSRVNYAFFASDDVLDMRNKLRPGNYDPTGKDLAAGKDDFDIDA